MELLAQEFSQKLNDFVQLIVVGPMPGIFDYCQFNVSKVFQGVILSDPVRIAMARIDDKHWTG